MQKTIPRARGAGPEIVPTTLDATGAILPTLCGFIAPRSAGGPPFSAGTVALRARCSASDSQASCYDEQPSGCLVFSCQKSARSPRRLTQPMSTEPPRDAEKPRTASFAQVAKAVLWSFFGIRKRRNLEQDAVTIRPHHAIIAGVIGMVLFVFLLLAIVRLILRNA
jgi:hypothetical protein